MRNISSKLAVKQSGFTLIELVIVIVIIGILAAVALPNFADITTDAKNAKGDAILGSMKSAYAIALAKNKGVAPSVALVIGQQTDPACTPATTPTVCGTATIAFSADPVTSTSQITCTAGCTP